MGYTLVIIKIRFENLAVILHFPHLTFKTFSTPGTKSEVFPFKNGFKTGSKQSSSDHGTVNDQETFEPERSNVNGTENFHVHASKTKEQLYFYFKISII
jgi:hypothetical protein